MLCVFDGNLSISGLILTLVCFLAAAAAATLAAKEGEFLASFVLCLGTP